MVFGRASGLFIEKALREGIEHRDASDSDLEQAASRLDKLNSSSGGESVAVLRKELQMDTVVLQGLNVYSATVNLCRTASKSSPICGRA